MAKKVIKKNNLNVEEKKQYLINRIDTFIEKESNDYFETIREKEYSISNLFDNISNMSTLENKFFNYLQKRNDRDLFELLITFDSCTDDSMQLIRTVLNVIGEKNIQKCMEFISNYIIEGFEYCYDEYPNLNKYSFILNMGSELGINSGTIYINDEYLITTVDNLLQGLRKSDKFKDTDRIGIGNTLIDAFENYKMYKMINSEASEYTVEYLNKLFKSFKCLDYHLTSKNNILCMMKVDEYDDFNKNK